MFTRLLEKIKKTPVRAVLIVVLLLGALTVYAISDSRSGKESPKPPAESFSALTGRITAGKVEKLAYDPNSLTVVVSEPKIAAYTIGVPGRAGEEAMLQAAEKAKVPVSSKPLGSGSSWGIRLFGLLPTLLIIGALLYLVRNMVPGKRSKLEPATSSVSFADIAGVDEAIEELAEVRDFLSDPTRYAALGARVPRGILLYGPPGTGKTLMAKAVAKEADVPFFHMSGSEFVEMFAGLGAARVRSLFKKAKESAPSIVFIDELDAVGRARGAGGSGADREADQTLNQLLTEMDGFAEGERPVVVIAASNRIDVLDKALLRPGRFDRHIAVDAPDRKGRLAVLTLHAQGKAFAEGIDLDKIAVQTSGMTGADLAHLLNEAAIFTARRRGTEIALSDIEDAYFRVAAGAKKQNRSFSDHERRVVAFHEAGHAVISERLETDDKVHKISIIPRGRSGGQTLFVSDEDVFFKSKPELECSLCALLGGRAAEQLIFQHVTTGAADDLKRASDLARSMVTRLGMGDSMGLLVVEERSQASSQQLADADAEVRKLLEERYQAATALLTTEMVALTRIAEALLDEETLDRDRFLELLNEEPASVPDALAVPASAS